MWAFGRARRSKLVCSDLWIGTAIITSCKVGSMPSILVTGGAGFLGSHLCERLLQRGDSVLCLDNFFSGRKENVQHLIGNPRFELIRHDIVHPIFLEAN